jgi:hypothetical protein
MRRLAILGRLLPALVLSGCGDPVVIDTAGRTMKQLAGGNRAQRLEALAQIPWYKVVPADCEAAVLECLADPDVAVRTDAAEALQYANPTTQAHLEPAVAKAFETEADAGVKRQLKTAVDVIRGVIASPDGNAAPQAPEPGPPTAAAP